ncbi:ribosome biogenesis GTP-binding protein YihA/YsxC [Peptoniphilus equinus]|uniref:Probable GTP-binding protein EngB n=1 Tax=Peptoniphilus equinus TaxID=3016343 RepID=A0ABY7QTQ3_9FIRM|nr:ribosome biogenesis GTP-binding protein YihA/YsxC [Peptoniphilus equinus]WBW50165.1 ribosome biogenesis GTP-binding protein YihA/YsxC [Peptoniphilus equinus]
MKTDKVYLEKVAVDPKGYPTEPCGEFAFAGRSNVGKSSFINAMVRRKNLARTSSAPGKTRTINFYRVADLRLVDLPGYGYAKVSKSERNSWAGIINTYLEARENLLEVLLLVDIRHKPSELDVAMYDYIVQSGYSGLVIATKADKVAKGQRARHLKVIADTLGVKERSNILTFSTSEKQNVEDMWAILEDIVRFYHDNEL